MRGLRTKESTKFENFIEIVQREAQRQKRCVFFLFAAEGPTTETEDLELADLSGWLVPFEQADEFEKEWADQANDLEKWADKYFHFVFWKGAPNAPELSFKQF